MSMASLSARLASAMVQQIPRTTMNTTRTAPAARAGALVRARTTGIAATAAPRGVPAGTLTSRGRAPSAGGTHGSSQVHHVQGLPGCVLELPGAPGPRLGYLPELSGVFLGVARTV